MKKKKMMKRIAVMMSAVMVLTLLPEASYQPAAAAEVENDADYAATPAQDREITTGAAGEERTWTIDWSDEFNGSALDSTKWSYMIGTGAEYSGDGWGNNEKEYYTEGENASVSDGNLQITARKLEDSEKANYSGKSYTSTRLWTMDDSANRGGEKTTKYSKMYGRIEARIKITSDSTDSTGLWPAFWMMPAEDVYGTWAASGELDIMEARGSNTGSVDGTIHYGSQWPNNKSNGGSYNKSSSLAPYDADFTTAEYHTYAVEWLPGEIRWYVDDQLFYKTSNWYSTTENNATDFTYPAPYDQNFYILLNLAVGGNYDGGALSDSWNEANMYVDYVRVYDLLDESTGEIADYAAMEASAVKPVEQADPNLVSGEINVTNYVDSALADIKETTSYPSESENEWYLSTMLGGTAAKSVADGALKVDVTAPGTQNYSVQLIHNVPLTKGYRYVLSFDAKADASKALTAKFGNIGGYPAYSDSYTVDLLPEWKHYTYTFDMTNTTDATGRIEFNLGLTTGACYFKNFSVICTGLIPTQGEDDAKEPLSNGNHVYNGTFDQGTGRYYYWHAGAGTAISVEKAALELTAVGTAADSYLYQKGMNLLGTDTYKVSLDARAQTAGDITVKLVSSDKSVVYGEKTFSITTSTANYSFEFTMEEATDTEGILEIVTGNHTVYLDNVTMIRTTNNNVDWSSVDFWPLYNGDFFNGDDGWNIWSENAGFQTHTVTDGVLNVQANIGANPDFWCVGVQSSAMSFTGGIPYKFTIHLNGSKDKTIKIETPDGIQQNYDFTAGDNTKVIEFKPASNITGKFSMYFGIGEGAYNFTIDSIDVEVDSSLISIPAGYAKPASLTSSGNVRAGSDIVLKYSDAAWASELTAAYINGTSIDLELVTVNQDQTLTIAAEAMPAAGTYSIKFDAEGYVQTKAITQTVLEAGGNLIVNGTFDTDLDGWTTYFSDWNVVNGTAAVQDGQADIHVVSTEGNNWDCQLKQSGIEVEASNYYLLQFDASATVNRPIQLEFGALGTPSRTIVDLTQEKKTYYIVLSGVGASSAASVLFMTGNVNGCLADFAAVGEHDIYIDNVSLYQASLSQVEAVQTPTVALTDSVILGEDVQLGYSQNSVWETKPITVTVNGTEVSSLVGIDTQNNIITIDKAAFTAAGSYTVAVQAAGYEAAVVNLQVLSSEDTNLFTGDWVTWLEPGEQGTITCLGDSFTVDFVSTMNSQWNIPEFWSIQARKTGITTLDGKQYKLSFDAELVYDDTSITSNRDMVIELGSGAAQHTISLEPGTHSYEYTFTPGASTSFYVLFMPGGNDYDLQAHTLAVSNISLIEIKDTSAQVALSVPGNLTALKAADSDSVEITWDAVKNAVLYQVYRAASESASYSYIGSSAANSYTDTPGNSGTYYYKIAALPETESTAYKRSSLSAASSGVEIISVVAVTGVTLDNDALTLTAGSTAVTLHAVVAPDNATNQNISWTSSNPGVASVAAGVVTPLSQGTATITVTTLDGGFQATCTVTVNAAPVNNNPGSSTPTPTPVPEAVETPGQLDIALDQLKADENGKVKLPIDTKDLQEALSELETDTFNINLTLAEDEETASFSGLILSEEVLQSIKDANKGLTIQVCDPEGNLRYRWTFTPGQLAAAQQLTDVDISMQTIKPEDVEGLDTTLGTEGSGQSIILHFSQDGVLPVQAVVRIYVGDLIGFTQGGRIYLYHYNKETGKLETLPYTSGYTVDTEGYINIRLVHCSDYVVSLKEAAAGKITSLKNQITVSPLKKTLYLNGVNTTQLQITLPSTLELVKSFTKALERTAIGQVTVSYSSSDNKVVKVDKNGKITAVGKGKAVITTKLTLYSGKTRTIKTVITVK